MRFWRSLIIPRNTWRPRALFITPRGQSLTPPKPRRRRPARSRRSFLKKRSWYRRTRSLAIIEGGRARLLRSGDKEIEFLDPAFPETEHASPSRRHFRPAIAGEVEKLENFTAQGKEIRAAAIARTIKCDRNDLLDRARPLRQDDDAVAHVNGFVDVVSNEEHGSAPVLPKARNVILHTHAREGVEGAERLIEQKYYGKINQGQNN